MYLEFNSRLFDVDNWLERNRSFFEDFEKTSVELKDLWQPRFFDWFRCWGFIDCSSLLLFFSSIRLGS